MGGLSLREAGMTDCKHDGEFTLIGCVDNPNMRQCAQCKEYVELPVSKLRAADYAECTNCPEPGACCHFAVQIGQGIGVWSDVTCPHLDGDGRCKRFEERDTVIWCRSSLYANTLFPIFCIHHKLHHPYLCTIDKAYEMWGLDGEHLHDFRDRINDLAINEVEKRFGVRLLIPASRSDNAPGTATRACSPDPGVGSSSPPQSNGFSSTHSAGEGGTSPAEGQK